jgi:hypothetical protein
MSHFLALDNPFCKLVMFINLFINTLIFEAFEYVAKSLFLIMECLLGNYTFFLISPWWLAWFPSKWVAIGKRVSTG